MSREYEYGWYKPAPKQPAPARGIRVKTLGTTWWGARWIEALDGVLDGQRARLARGKSYARAGRVHDLVVEAGEVTASVTGSRVTPYRIAIELAQLDAAAWRRAIGGMARKAQFAAELLAGQLPHEIDEVFREAGVSLFPQQRADLHTSCSCPDWGDPCKHVAAAHYVLGEALDRDPFLLFELRGRTKAQVLEALRAARGTPGEPRRRSRASAGTPLEVEAREVPSVKLGRLKAADYDRPRAPLPSLRFTFDEPTAHGALLRQLGEPAGWLGEASPADVLAPLVRAAAEAARRIALAETSEADEHAAPAARPSPSRPRARRRDNPT